MRLTKRSAIEQHVLHIHVCVLHIVSADIRGMKWVAKLDNFSSSIPLELCAWCATESSAITVFMHPKENIHKDIHSGNLVCIVPI